MRQPDDVETPRASGPRGAEKAEQGEISEAESGTHGRSNVIPFPRHSHPHGRCTGCQAPLGEGDGMAYYCRTCRDALDLVARISERMAMPRVLRRP